MLLLSVLLAQVVQDPAFSEESLYKSAPAVEEVALEERASDKKASWTLEGLANVETQTVSRFLVNSIQERNIENLEALLDKLSEENTIVDLDTVTANVIEALDASDLAFLDGSDPELVEKFYALFSQEKNDLESDFPDTTPESME